MSASSSTIRMVGLAAKRRSEPDSTTGVLRADYRCVNSRFRATLSRPAATSKLSRGHARSNSLPWLHEASVTAPDDDLHPARVEPGERLSDTGQHAVARFSRHAHLEDGLASRRECVLGDQLEQVMGEVAGPH